jgi:membrane-bound lytic murein transglycosylase B
MTASASPFNESGFPPVTIKQWMYSLFTAGLLASSAASADPAFTACLPGLQQRALAAGVTPATVNAVLANTNYVARVIELDRRQPEFSETFHNYLTARVTEQRIQQGRQMLAQHRPLLEKLQQQYGVPPQYLMAFWGLETNYGSYLGKMPVLDSLATLACDQRRSEFFTLELIDALKLVDANVVTPALFVGSWAGAVGNMQFMPSAYRAHAIDGDGDGRADLWRSIPDALTSAANYLNSMGWKKETRWGREVLLPAGFDYNFTSLAERHPLSFWRQQGVVMANGAQLPDLPMQASILVPSGHTGPAFIVYDNFDIIMRWNRSEFYAIAVGHLADRINGGSGLKRQPPNMARFTNEQIRQLQIALNGAGFDSGQPDGVLGSGTRKAVRAFQKSKGLIADGFPSQDVFVALGVAQP